MLYIFINSSVLTPCGGDVVGSHPCGGVLTPCGGDVVGSHPCGGVLTPCGGVLTPGVSPGLGAGAPGAQ